MCLWGIALLSPFSCEVAMCLGGGGLHRYNNFRELKFLCVCGGRGGLHFCTFIRLLLGCALMWVRNTTCQIRLQTSDFIPIAVSHVSRACTALSKHGVGVEPPF